jgi:hypothetical protein
MLSGQIHIYYPRGFRRFVIGVMPETSAEEHVTKSAEGHQVVYSNGDSEVKELYRRYKATEDTATWKFHVEVLKCAKRLIPHAASFFFFQAQNARLHSNGMTYLQEVISYIETGRCSMQPLTAFELIEDHPERETSAINGRKVKPLSISEFFGDGIVQWVSHSRGFEHLVETLYVMFGPARVEKEAELPIRTLSERKLTKGWMKISGE